MKLYADVFFMVLNLICGEREGERKKKKKEKSFNIKYDINGRFFS